MSQLSAYLRTELTQRQWSERELARRAGISLSALQNLLNDENALPKLPTLDGLARALQVRMSKLIELAGFDLGDESPAAFDHLALTEEDLATLAQAKPGELRTALDLIRKARDG